MNLSTSPPLSLYNWLHPTFHRIHQDALSNRLPHALLIHGREGIGVIEFTTMLAHYRLCTNASETGACGQCKACQLVNSASHPDLRILEPEGAARVIKVDQIRSLVGFIAQTPQIGEWKVVVLQSAHRMNQNAANALLKMLEEPAGNTLLILATERPQLLLPTVRSRCSQLRLPSPTQNQALAFLEAKGVTSDKAQSAINKLGPYPIKIAQWINHETLPKWQAVMSELKALESGQKGAVAVATALKDIDFGQLLDWLIEHSAEQMKSLLKAKNDSYKSYEALYSQILESKRSLESGSNPNPQLALEALLLSWPASS